MPHVGTTTREPMRTCVGCRSTRPQSSLRRCALGIGGTPIVSRTAPGRGAWVCSAACAERAARRGGFARTWRRQVSAEALHTLIDAVSIAEQPADDTPSGTLVTTPLNMRQSRAAGPLTSAPSPTKG